MQQQSKSDKYKIFIGLTEIAGYYGNLKRGFQEIGIECIFINFDYHPYQYGGDDEPNILVIMYKWSRNQMIKCEHKFLKAPFFASALILKVFIFIWAIYKYNVFLFGFGSSFFNQNIDLRVLKFFNKKVIFTFFGSDGRPPYINGALLRYNPTLEYYKTLTRRIKSNIALVEKYADAIITQPAISQFHKRKHGNFISIGHPFSSSIYENCVNINTTDEIVIIHAPSDPIGKGSALIRASINKLELKGYKINFIEITGKPHKDVIDVLQKCDFIVDQVFSDLPMPGFAIEAAWFGKPAVIGGYYVNYIRYDCPPKHIPPSLYCHPDEITSAIERLIVDEEFRLELGKRAQEFVRTKFTPKQVAERYLQIIEGSIPEEFMFDPNTIRYVQGYGMPESQSKEIVRNMIEKFGIESLCISDKSNLERRFREYAFEIQE